MPGGSASTVWGAIGNKWKHSKTLVGALLVLLLLIALLLSIVVVGRCWFGWSYIADNKELLDSLPVAPGVERISVVSSSYSSDELVFIPPDGWGTRATYRAPPDVSEKDVVDFYISNLSPQWQYCENYVNSIDLLTRERGVVTTGVFFKRGPARVSVDILNMTQAPHSFDIAVNHNADSDPCD